MVKFIEPRPLAPVDQARAALRRFSPGLECLAEALLACSPTTQAAFVGDPVAHLINPDRTKDGLDSGPMVRVLRREDPPEARLLDLIHHRLPVDDVNRLLKAGHSAGLPLEAALHRKSFLERPAMAAVLLRAGVVQVPDAIDWDEDELVAATTAEIHEGYWIDRFQKRAENPRSLVFWLGVAPQHTLTAIRLRLAVLPDPGLGKGLHAAVVGLRVACRYLLETNIDHLFAEPQVRRRHMEDFAGHFRPEGSTVLEGIFHDVWQRRAVVADGDLLQMWRIAFDGREQQTPAEETRILVDMASRRLGQLRTDPTPLLGNACSGTAVDDLLVSSRVLYNLDSLWRGMKALLLLLRAIPVPAFAPNLSWWNEATIAGGRGAAALAQELMYGFQSHARYEQEHDDKLEHLRSEFARFLLDRLTDARQSRESRGLLEDGNASSEPTAKKRTNPREPDPAWRVAAIRAVHELGVNPGGRGHHVLHRASEQDPDADVRAAAAAVYQDLRQGKPLPKGMSPRRAVLMALWWLRQAHLHSVGVIPDEEGAQQTRVEEVRFTTRRLSDDD